MIEAIATLARETGRDWFSVLMALKTSNLLTPTQIKNIEDHFFTLEDKVAGRG